MAIEETISNKYMIEAIRQAKKARSLGEVPIGCVIVHEGKIIGRGYNRCNTDRTTLAHAEIAAIKKASKAIGDWRLEECTLYVTLEPCQMCAGAIVQARIPQVVIGCMNPKAGCAGSILNILEHPGFNHQVHVIRGIMEEECSEMLKTFFAELRARNTAEKERQKALAAIKTTDTIRREIRAVDTEWKKIFSVKKKFGKKLFKWQNDVLYDMYDQNAFVPVCDTVTEEVDTTGSVQDMSLTMKDFEKAVEYQKAHSLNFLKFESLQPIESSLCKELEDRFGLEGDETYIMYLPKKSTESWKCNEKVKIFDVKSADITSDIRELEVKNADKSCGKEFIIRSTDYLTKKAKKVNNFHYLGAFLEDKIVGACCVYVKNGYTLIDSLLVDEDERKQYVATTLMAYIAERYSGTLFLHAYAEDTTKDMYAKMGFQVIDSLFEYCATWN